VSVANFYDIELFAELLLHSLMDRTRWRTKPNVSKNITD